jgi:hypothetical protein
MINHSNQQFIEHLQCLIAVFLKNLERLAVKRSLRDISTVIKYCEFGLDNRLQYYIIFDL